MPSGYLVVVEVVEGGDDGDDAGVTAVHLLYALEWVWWIILHEGQVIPRLKPPRLVCTVHVKQDVASCKCTFNNIQSWKLGSQRGR